MVTVKKHARLDSVRGFWSPSWFTFVFDRMCERASASHLSISFQSPSHLHPSFVGIVFHLQSRVHPRLLETMGVFKIKFLFWFVLCLFHEHCGFTFWVPSGRIHFQNPLVHHTRHSGAHFKNACDVFSPNNVKNNPQSIALVDAICMEKGTVAYLQWVLLLSGLLSTNAPIMVYPW